MKIWMTAALLAFGVWAAGAASADPYPYRGVWGPVNHVVDTALQPVETIFDHGVLGGTARLVVGAPMRVGSPSDGMTSFHHRAQRSNEAWNDEESDRAHAPVSLRVNHSAYGVEW
ncbi:MAG: hypothetical protein KC466_19415 [Myxococcales bacterium]|nr:hypothetical protein [Myxococcales bacterium]